MLLAVIQSLGEDGELGKGVGLKHWKWLFIFCFKTKRKEH